LTETDWNRQNFQLFFLPTENSASHSLDAGTVPGAPDYDSNLTASAFDPSTAVVITRRPCGPAQIKANMRVEPGA